MIKQIENLICLAKTLEALELLENHLIEPVEEAWYSTYKLSDFGRKVMTFNKYENV